MTAGTADPTGVSRRTLFRGAAALSGLALLGGCATRDEVWVAVPWSGWELSRFRAVLADFERDTGLVGRVVPLGDDIGAVLRAGPDGIADVVVLPRPGLVRQFHDVLQPLDPRVWPEGRFADGWKPLLRDGGGDGPVLGVPFKAAHKSVVWYRRDLLAQVPLSVPGRGWVTNDPRTWGTFDDWAAVVRELVRWGVTPLALGAADGWVLTDFFENVLLSTSPATYRELARGTDLWQDTNTRSALIDVGRVWAEPGALAGGASQALLTQFEESVLDLVYGRAAMLVAPDFAYPVIRRYLPSDREFGERIDVFRFPPITVGRPPLVTGGDVLVLPKPGSEAGRRLVTWLARPGAAAQWIRYGGFVPPQQGGLSGVRPAEIPRRLVQEWQEATSSQGQGLYFDLSDELGALGGGDGQGLWTVLQDFLAEIGGYPGRVRSAAEAAARRMSDLRARTKGAWNDPPR